MRYMSLTWRMACFDGSPSASGRSKPVCERDKILVDAYLLCDCHGGSVVAMVMSSSSSVVSTGRYTVLASEPGPSLVLATHEQGLPM